MEGQAALNAALHGCTSTLRRWVTSGSGVAHAPDVGAGWALPTALLVGVALAEFIGERLERLGEFFPRPPVILAAGLRRE
jgi:hypothetical protein